MRMFESSVDQLSVFTRPNWLLMVLGAIMVMIATVVALIPAKATTFECKRLNGMGSCEMIETRLMHSSRFVRIPERLIEKAVVTPQNINGKTAFYHVNLVVNDGEGEFYFAWYGKLADAEADVQNINAYLTSKDRTAFTVVNDKRPAYFGIAMLMIFLGIVFVFWGSQSLHATFNREDGRVTVLRRGLLGSRRANFAMSDIRSVDVKGLGGDCQLYLELNSGQRMDLSSSNDTEGMVGPSRVRAARLVDAKRIRDFCEPESVATLEA